MKIEIIAVLDQGYVEFIEAWGTGTAGCDPWRFNSNGQPARFPDFECGIIESARQSTQGAFRGWEQDAKLLKHLYENHHDTPFEFAGMTIEVRAPLFVFREWHRHRTQSYNEASARYAPLPALNYMPSLERAMTQPSSANKQAGTMAVAPINESKAKEWLALLDAFYSASNELYEYGLQEGLLKELARLPMTVGHYSHMRVSANLRNWLAFLTLRMDPSAQWEIRQFANAVGEFIKQTFPQTWALFQTV